MSSFRCRYRSDGDDVIVPATFVSKDRLSIGKCRWKSVASVRLAAAVTQLRWRHAYVFCDGQNDVIGARRYRFARTR